jgi:hypothetical protein
VNQHSKLTIEIERFAELSTLSARLSWSGRNFWAGLSQFGKVTYFEAYLPLMSEGWRLDTAPFIPA